MYRYSNKYHPIYSLSDSEDLDQVVQLVGKSALSDPDKITLDVSSLIKEDFLQQNGYSKHDQYCPIWKTLWMMKAMMAFYDESQKAVQAGVQWSKIREATADVQHQLRSMKFEVSLFSILLPSYIPVIGEVIQLSDAE